MSDVKCPGVKVCLSKVNGNAYAIMGVVVKAMWKANVAKEIIDEFNKESTSGDYDHLMQTCFKYVEVE